MKLNLLTMSILSVVLSQYAVAEDTITLPSITISAEQKNNPDAYLQKNSSSATRTQTAIQDTPQSVSVVSQGVLEDIGASRLLDALNVAGGVGISNNFGAQGLAKYTSRGFSSGEFFRNGFPINRGYPAIPDSSNIERIDVIRGPSSAMYGRSDPSGTFNIVTKQPEKERQTTIGLQGNNYGTYRGTLDTTGAINQDKTLTYRLNVAGEGGETFRDDVHVKRYDIAPVLQWQPTDQTKITFEADLLRNQQPYDKGFTHYPHQNYPQFDAKTYFWQTGKERNRLYSANDAYQFRVEHQLNDNWKLNVGAQYINGDVHGYALEPRGSDVDSNGNIPMGYSWRKLSWIDKDIQANITGHFNLWGLEHTLLTGIEYEDYDYKAVINRNASSANLSVNPFNPASNQTLPTLNPFYTGRENLTSYAAFVQDQVDLTSRLKALMSLRVEHYKQDNTTNAKFWKKNTDAVLPRFGLSYAMTPDWSVYGNISTSFLPIPGEFSQDQANNPEKGIVYELGSKWQLFDDQLSLQSAVYYTKKKDVLSQVVDNSALGYSYQTIGEAESKGFELNLAGQFTPSWKVLGGYSYTDAKVTKDPQLKGRPLQNIPKNSFNVLSVYEFKSGTFSGLGLGVNQRYIGQRYGQNGTYYFKLKSYSVTDALAYYKVNDQLRFNLDVKNIFNKRYDESSYMLFSYPGEPRTFQFGATYRF